jgi:RNA polymerase sigma factor (sigma-70 family)
MSHEVAKLLSTLDEDEEKVIRLRFGLDHGDPRTQEGVGQLVGLSRERIRRLEDSAMAKLRQAAEDTEASELLSA